MNEIRFSSLRLAVLVFVSPAEVSARGFRGVGSLAGETSQWEPCLVKNNDHIERSLQIAMTLSIPGTAFPKGSELCSVV